VVQNAIILCKEVPVKVLHFKLLLISMAAVLASSCGDDDTPTQANPTPRSLSVVGSQDYTWADIALSNFPSGSQLALRSPYWSTAELMADPQARVSAQSQTVYRLEFMNLNSGIFASDTARVLLVVQDSAVNELQGIVVLCDSTGPIILSPECAGDCAPLCGLPGHDCDG
jgi:hypothetical protein